MQTKQELRRERCYTVQLTTGDYKVYPESVVYAVQVETVYSIAQKRLKDEIKAIIKNVYKREQPNVSDGEKLAKYQKIARKMYENLPKEQQQIANKLGTKKYTELQY